MNSMKNYVIKIFKSDTYYEARAKYFPTRQNSPPLNNAEWKTLNCR